MPQRVFDFAAGIADKSWDIFNDHNLIPNNAATTWHAWLSADPNINAEVHGALPG